MIQPKQLLAQSIIQLCKNHNIQHIVISPGSRNAPLTIGFTNHDFFDCYSIVDERCAKIAEDLEKNWAVVAEAIQTILRREGFSNPYEALKGLTRTNEAITQNSISNFIDTLEVSDTIKTSQVVTTNPFVFTYQENIINEDKKSPRF